MTRTLDRAEQLIAERFTDVPGQLALDVADGLRVGSLCSGYGGLDMAVCDVLGASVAWHCQYDPDDKHQYAARILAEHWPDVPNLGDITLIEWVAILALYGPIDVLTAGFPCQDVSLAGLRAGIAEGTRSGLWAHVARAISVLRPRLVVIENVRGLLSAKAARGVGPDGTPLDEDSAGTDTLRAIGAVLGDLAGLGFDAEWHVQRASDIGAPHQRARVFVIAWPAADSDHERGERSGGPGREPQRHVAGPRPAAADAQGEGRQRCGVRGRPTGGRAAAQDANRTACGERGLAAPAQEEAGRARPDARRRGRAPVADANRGGLPRHQESAAGRDTVRPGVRGDADGCRGTAPHAEGQRRHQGEPGPEARRRNAVACGRSGIDWGPYAHAVARWEAITQRPAPRPTDDRGRLTAAFVEWMMGLDSGHVTGVPGLSRPAQLRALGNGVVPQQAAYVLRLLLRRAGIAERFGLTA
ncbi:DNA cytosine methyltransferase [Streptomyces sp. CC224B]|uniref:DNA cytosine methyltransferase n=1 Tax=Streptomyces sp. CC224B TaxID=3044571 RepID=UPI0024A9CBEE|nr:DNA cytosine methyltransferase [Streptomyces sp. CC224B]